MIKQRERVYIPNVEKSVLCKLKSMARHNRDEELKSYIADIVEYYIAEVRGTDYVRPEDTMLIDRKPYEATCPDCGRTFYLNMEEIENVQV